MKETTSIQTETFKASISKVLLQTIISACVVGFINFMIGYLTLPDIVISIDKPITLVNGNKIEIISIINYSNKIANNIEFSIPSSEVDIQSSRSTGTSLNVNNTESIFTIQSIPINSNNQYIVNYKPTLDERIEFNNFNNNDIKIVDKYESYKPFNGFAKNFTIQSIVMILFYLFFFAMMDRSDKKLQKSKADFITTIQNKNKEQSRLYEELESTKKSLKNFKKIELKGRLLYLNRIKEYKSELDFWRNLVKQIVLDKSNSKELINTVTKKLATYQTIGDDVENDWQYTRRIIDAVIEE